MLNRAEMLSSWDKWLDFQQIQGFTAARTTLFGCDHWESLTVTQSIPCGESSKDRLAREMSMMLIVQLPTVVGIGVVRCLFDAALSLVRWRDVGKPIG
jgi:hypothetical protein